MYPHSDERLRPVESGASIFVDANRYLVKAAKVGEITHNPNRIAHDSFSTLT